MPFKTTLLTFLFAIHFVTGFSQQIKIDSSSVKTLRIDPQNGRGATVSQLFDEVEFIPLETTKESLFGNISQLRVVDNNFVFMDYDTRAVLIFTKEGKFRAKISATQISDQDDKGKGGFWGFIIVKEDNQNVIQIPTSKYAFCFNLDGKQIRKMPIKDFAYISPFRFGDNQTSLTGGDQKIIGKDTTMYQLGYVRNNRDTTLYFPYKAKHVMGGGERIYNYGNPNEFLYFNLYSYDLFKINPEKISLAYHIVLPAANTVPKDFINNRLYWNNPSEFFQNNKGICYSLSNTYLLNDNLFLKLHTSGWNKSIKRSFIYNLKTTELISLEDIEADARSYYLPVTDAGAFFDFINYGFQIYENGYLYTNYSSLAMLTFKEQSAGKTMTYPPALENYFKTATKKNNPIIIKLKPKTN